MTTLFRISGKAYIPQDPTGAALSSEGRWHVKGQRVLYFSTSLPMCVLELRANGISYRTIRERNHFATLELPAKASSETVAESFYKKGWQDTKSGSQRLGSEWYLSRRTLVLAVRSAVLPTESNYVLNTAHPDFAALRFSAPLPVPLDTRLVEIEDMEMR